MKLAKVLGHVARSSGIDRNIKVLDFDQIADDMFDRYAEYLHLGYLDSLVGRSIRKKRDLLEPEQFSVALDDVLIVPLNQNGLIEPKCQLSCVNFGNVGVSRLRCFVFANGS